MVFCRAPYNYDADQASLDAGTAGADDGLTKQSFAEEADINTLVRRFGLTGELPQAVRMPQYADFEDAFDYHSAMNAIVAARESFMSMPADVRARFNNDPGVFVDFCGDPVNREEAIKLGLVEAPIATAAPGADVAGTVTT